jgi:hypothetical protein
MAGGRNAEFRFAATRSAFGLNRNITEPFGDAQEGFLHKD